MMIGTLVLALSWAAGDVSAGDCSPPHFYTSLPRDREWFYGVARDADTDKARDAAVRNLGKQVGGGVEGWDDKQIAAIAGPGRDRSIVGEAVDIILTQTPLAGWEQDDHERCNGYSYALVRVSKEKAQQFLRENAKFRSALLEHLDKKITRIGNDLESMKVAYAKLSADLQLLKQQQGRSTVPGPLNEKRERVEKIMSVVKKGLDRGQADSVARLRLQEAVNVMVDLKLEDIASLEKYEAVIKIEESEASSEKKAESWRTLAKELPAYAALAKEKAEQWDSYAAQKRALDDGRGLRIVARDEDWLKLSRLLKLSSIPEADKRRRSEQFVAAYLESPGIDRATAAELAKHLPLGPEKNALRVAAGKMGIEWVTIPGGSFMMGADNLGGAQPRHSVTVRTFLMAKTTVTAGQYKKCVEAGICKKPICDSSGKDSYGDDYPVVCVNWEQAAKFSEWVGGRLPSEAEWEYAARSADKDWKYPWGNENVTCERAVTSDCGDKALPVCSKPAGNTAQGLCDMAGNVLEWTQDWYHGSYEGAPTDGSAWGSPATSAYRAYRATRGGRHWFYGDVNSPAAIRSFNDPDDRLSQYIGFRPVRSHLEE